MASAPPMDVSAYLQEKAGSAPPMDPAKYLAEKTSATSQPTASTAQALFPRASAAKGALKTALGGAEDALTGILRVPAAAGAAAAGKMGLTSDLPKFGRVPQGTTFTGALDNLNKGQNEWGNPSLIAKMGQDPATVPTSVMPVAKIGQGATWLGRIAQGAFAGGQMGAAGGALHQIDSYIQEKGLDMGQAAKEIMAGTGLGGVLSSFGEVGKELGTKIVRAAIKPGFIGTREGVNVDKAMQDNMAGGFGSMGKKFAELKAKAGQGIEAALSKNSSKTIPGGKLITDLNAEMTQNIKDGVYGLNHPEAQKALQDITDRLRPYVDPMTGTIPLQVANKLKSGLQNDASRIYEAARVPNAAVSNMDMVKEQLSRSLAKKFQDEIEHEAPEIKQSNLDYAFAKPFLRAVQKRAIIKGQANPVGLDEAVMLEGLGNLAAGDESSAPLWKALALRASKQPAVGSALYQGGKKAPLPLTRMSELLSNLNQGKQ